MDVLQNEQLWQHAFPDGTRPLLYLDDNRDEDGFRLLADPQSFVADVSGLSHLQLYATTSNNQTALKQAQDEYLEISRQIAALKGKDPLAKNPRALQDPDEFEERKEASLYGYKYEHNRPALLHNGIIGNRAADDITDQEKRDVRLFQNPFEQGGFVPTEKQYKGMLARSTEPKNIDGWKPLLRKDKRLIPRQNKERLEYTNIYVRRNIDENGELIRPDSSGTDDSIATPSKVENKRLTRTRFGGKKVPPTRDVSEAPSIASTPGRKRAATPAFDGRDSTPASKRRRPNVDDRPRHPNQYTKAKELAAQQAAKSAINGTESTPGVMPDWSKMPREQLLSRKWTDEELVDSVKKDHAWLHPESARSLEWRDKIVNGLNPVRSWSMLKKWGEWKASDRDKRPRKKLGPEDSKEVTPLAELVEDVKMERTVSEGGSEAMRRIPRAMGMNGSGQGVDRSATVTPTQPRRSARHR
jgi:hypothetical protein